MKDMVRRLWLNDSDKIKVDDKRWKWEIDRRWEWEGKENSWKKEKVEGKEKLGVEKSESGNGGAIKEFVKLQVW